MGEARRKLLSGNANRDATLTFRLGYLLIIEWLGDERKTGAELAQAVSQNDGAHVELVQCGDHNDVFRALAEAAERFRAEGRRPIVHIETHGIQPELGQLSPGIAGPNGDGGIAQILWKELAAPMRELNIATGFNLVIVGAACFGLSQIDTFDVENAAPFSVAVGFADRVSVRTLYDAMRAFYRHIFAKTDTSIVGAVNAANKELLAGEGEVLNHTNCLKFGTHLMKAFAERELDPVHRPAALAKRQARLAEQGKFLSIEQIDSMWNTHIIASCERSVAKWFAYDEIPANRARFKIDVGSIFEAEKSASHQR